MTSLLNNAPFFFKNPTENIDRRHQPILLQTFIVLFALPLGIALLAHLFSSNINEPIWLQFINVAGLVVVTYFALVAIRANHIRLALHTFLFFILFLAWRAPLPNPALFLVIVSVSCLRTELAFSDQRYDNLHVTV